MISRTTHENLIIIVDEPHVKNYLRNRFATNIHSSDLAKLFYREEI